MHSMEIEQIVSIENLNHPHDFRIVFNGGSITYNALNGPLKFWYENDLIVKETVMLVYRLEHLIGCGPYHCDKLKFLFVKEKWEELDKLSHKLCDTHSFSDNHPIPNRGFIHKRSCACESFDKLCDWFDGFLEDFAKFGYVISVYEAFDFEIGFNQVSFDKKDAVLIERVKIL